jgi:hypothetical protein
MGIRRSMARALVLTVVLAAPGVLAQVAYPAKGQSEEQQSTDMGECRGWATRHTGFDPNTPPPQYVPPSRRQGGVAGGAVLGAALGAIAGGDSSSAGKGAAIGGVFGGARQALGNKDAETRARANHDQAMYQYQQRRSEHERAQGACLEARGYTVR